MRLTPARQLLLELLLAVRYGRLENLRIANGDPVFSPAPNIIRTVKLGQDGEYPVTMDIRALSDKPQVISLLNEIGTLADGSIVRLEIRDSLPCFLEVALGTEVCRG